jgi:hypothetical protein
MGSGKTRIEDIEGRQFVHTIQDRIAEYPLVLDVPISQWLVRQGH